MIPSRIAPLAAAAALAVRGAEPPYDIPEEVVRRVDPSVVAIQHERGAGSGFS